MEILVVYDVNTETKNGERRLRRVAKLCEGYGHRVQYSVFECILDQKTLRQLIHDLEALIDAREDRVGVYRLKEPHHQFVRRLGQDDLLDQRAPFVL